MAKLPQVRAAAVYPAVYEDKHGREQTEIRNDGQSLAMKVRGVLFTGSDFDGLAPPAEVTPELLQSFVLRHGELTDYVLRWTMPLTLVADGKELSASLDALLVLGAPACSGRPGEERFALVLHSPVGDFRSGGTSGWFEDELLELQARLPGGVSLKACITCAWSDYSPYGHGLFGDMVCFRDEKAAYAQVASKAELFDLWDRHTEFVQETFLCPEFSRRRRGAGYRG